MKLLAAAVEEVNKNAILSSFFCSLFIDACSQIVSFTLFTTHKKSNTK